MQRGCGWGCDAVHVDWAYDLSIQQCLLSKRISDIQHTDPRTDKFPTTSSPPLLCPRDRSAYGADHPTGNAFANDPTTGGYGGSAADNSCTVPLHATLCTTRCSTRCSTLRSSKDPALCTAHGTAVLAARCSAQRSALGSARCPNLTCLFTGRPKCLI